MSDDEAPAVDGRALAALTLGVVVVSAVVATGFTALSTNPLQPNATLAVADADDEYDLGEPGRVGLVTVSHVEGEPVPVATLRIVFGSQSDGLAFSAATNWTLAVGGMEYRVYHDGRPLRNDTASPALDPGETLHVTKTSGTHPDPPQNATTTIRVFHEPSQTVLASEEVTLR